MIQIKMLKEGTRTVAFLTRSERCVRRSAGRSVPSPAPRTDGQHSERLKKSAARPALQDRPPMTERHTTLCHSGGPDKAQTYPVDCPPSLRTVLPEPLALYTRWPLPAALPCSKRFSGTSLAWTRTVEGRTAIKRPVALITDREYHARSTSPCCRLTLRPLIPAFYPAVYNPLLTAMPPAWSNADDADATRTKEIKE